MQHQFTVLVELPVTHQHDPSVEVGVAPIQTDCLADPHPGDGQEPNQRREGRSAQRRRQRLRRRHQRDDVLIGEQIGRAAVGAPRQQADSGHLMRWIQRMQIGGEPADDREAIGTPCRPGVGRQQCPRQRGGHADGDLSRVFEVVQELPK